MTELDRSAATLIAPPDCPTIVADPARLLLLRAICRCRRPTKTRRTRRPAPDPGGGNIDPDDEDGSEDDDDEDDDDDALRFSAAPRVMSVNRRSR